MAQAYQQFSPLAALGFVQQQGEIGRERGKENRLNQLASLAYSAPADQRDSILSQAASVDAGAAQGLEKQMAYSDERRNASMVNMARLLTNAPEQSRAGLYRSMVPTLSRFGLSDMPQDYTPETAPVIMQAAQSLVQAYQGTNATPTDVRSFQMMTAGLSPEDQMRARRINLGLDGRASNAGYGFFEFDGADGRKRMGRNNPRTGDREVYDEASGEFVPLGGIGGGVTTPPQGQDGQHFGDFTSLAGEFPGVTMTSGMRTAERNQQVGGTPNSQHLTGTAADYAVPQQLKPAFMSRARQMGYQAIDEGDHIHLQLPRGGRSASAGLAVGRRKEDEARAVAQAQSDVELGALPTRLGMQTDADIAKARGVEQAKSEQERASTERAKTAQLNNVDRGLTRIDEALKNLTGSLIDTGPIDGRLMVSTPQGQELEAAVGAIQNDMLALTRVPGIGSQSDLEAKIANLKYPSIYNHPSVNAANVKQLREFMVDLRRQITGSSAGSGGRAIVRTGTSNGRKVIQYSDGSVEYGN
jgi:hypothetical protein